MNISHNHSAEPLLKFILTSIFLSLFITIVILILSKVLPTKLPLFYSLAWGENQLATTAQMLIIPAAIACIALVNLLIFWELSQDQIFFKRIIIFTSLLISLILTISFMKIILIFL